MGFLQALQSRQIWTHSKDIIREGDIVLLKDDACVPYEWLMAVVTRMFPKSSQNETAKRVSCYEKQVMADVISDSVI